MKAYFPKNIKLTMDTKRVDSYGRLWDILFEKRILDSSITATKFLDLCVKYAEKYFKHEEDIKLADQLMKMVEKRKSNNV